VYDHSLTADEEYIHTSMINTDLINYGLVYSLKVPEVNLLHIVCVRYRGFNVIAQCLIPGVLTLGQGNFLKYGSMDKC
jgi:hypothetical protein